MFALRNGADPTSAELWPLAVDGLLVLASAGLLKSDHRSSRRANTAVWLAFLLGIGVSLAANIAAAPTLAWQPVLVAGWPPVSLLLAVELLGHHHRPRQHIAAAQTSAAPIDTACENETVPARQHRVPRAELVMWAHFQREQDRGRIPTGAELDRVAGTNNYGRAVLRRWRTAGHIPVDAASTA
jgi:hypothetical protein